MPLKKIEINKAVLIEVYGHVLSIVIEIRHRIVEISFTDLPNSMV